MGIFRKIEKIGVKAVGFGVLTLGNGVSATGNGRGNEL